MLTDDVELERDTSQKKKIRSSLLVRLKVREREGEEEIESKRLELIMQE